MNPAVIALFASTDWAIVGPSVILFADESIRRYRWAGLRVTRSARNEASINGMGAEDFLNFAIEKLVRGVRAYRQDMSVEQNLRRTIESDIFNFHKKAGRLPLAQRTLENVLAGDPDPVEEAMDTSLPSNPAEAAETIMRQRALLGEFVESLADDEELTWLVLAFEEQMYKSSEVEQATGIPAARVSELKRKLARRADKFFNQKPEYADLNPVAR
jgi:hypothetical protein